MYSFTGRLPLQIKPRGTFKAGITGNQNSGGSYNRLSGMYYFGHPCRVNTLYWDIAVTQTYSIQLVSNMTNSPTILKTIIAGVSLTGAAENIIQLPEPLYFFPGQGYFVSLYCSSAVVMRRYSTGTPVQAMPHLINWSITYNGGSTGTGSVPVRFEGMYWEISR